MTVDMPPEWEPCLETTRRFEAGWEARLQRTEDHLDLIATTAWQLGRQMIRYEITRADVDRRLARLVDQLDPVLSDDTLHVPLVNLHEGRRVAVDALRRGMKEGADR